MSSVSWTNQGTRIVVIILHFDFPFFKDRFFCFRNKSVAIQSTRNIWIEILWNYLNYVWLTFPKLNCIIVTLINFLKVNEHTCAQFSYKLLNLNRYWISSVTKGTCSQILWSKNLNSGLTRPETQVSAWQRDALTKNSNVAVL